MVRAMPESGQHPVPIKQHVPHRNTAISGRVIPARDAFVRREVARLYSEATWLAATDMSAAIRYVTLAKRFVRMAQHLEEKDSVTNLKGEPLAMDAALRATSAELSRLEAQLGLTASARAALGVDLARMQDLATAMSAKESGD
jgi:hypothetical protein